jgi:hypothetical protein
LVRSMELSCCGWCPAAEAGWAAYEQPGNSVEQMSEAVPGTRQ